MNREYNSRVSSKNSERLLKNLKNTTGDYFFMPHPVYPQVAGVPRFISLLATSEPSERLFNTAVLMYTTPRNRLLAELSGRFSSGTILNLNDLNELN